MFPLSFAEYRTTRPESKTADQTFQRYLTYGGMPYTTHLNDEQSIDDYLGGVFNTILVKGIVARRPKIDMPAFNEVAAFLADNAGNLTSITDIANRMKQAHTAVSRNTIREYISALCDNYLLFRADRYDIKGKSYLQTTGKYCLGDPGFRFCFLANRSATPVIASRTWSSLNCCAATRQSPSARQAIRRSISAQPMPTECTTTKSRKPFSTARH
ncbi:ATPase [Bifidobacterium bohemicum DSM 22767]|uniref:ATPase n=1 Tax=Bifidobacterium bohemicum DSM 22767 TaxID=1437606 RepID=A0A086ZHE7_9BIFI|nr:ATPase [Bifidobacterium bohemicum DSM 22767]